MSRRTSASGRRRGGRTSSSSSRSRKYSRGDKARFPVGQVAPGLLAEFHNAVCAKPTTWGLAIDKNLVSMVSECRVAMPFHMCEKRLIDLPAQFGGHFEGADELASSRRIASTGVLSRALLG